MRQLDDELAQLVRDHHAAVERLSAVPGLGSIRRSRSSRKWVQPPPPSPTQTVSVVGRCLSEARRSAGVNQSHRSPNRNRQICPLLNQAANAVVKTEGSIFELVY